MRLIAVTLLWGLCGSTVHADDAAAIYSRLLHSTAWVRTSAQGVGTGWVVDAKRRWLITNLHIVGDQDRVEAFFVDSRDKQPITERQHYLENQKRLHDEGKAVRGKVIARRESCDLALIELDKLPDGAVALPLAREIPGPGAKVQSVGNRHDAEALWLGTSGEVRQVGRLADGYFWHGKKLASGMPCLIAQLPVHPGDSGGAVVDEKGEVVGVVSGVRPAPLAAIVIQAAEVRKLLAVAKKSETASNPAAPGATEIYRNLLNATVWVRPGATEGRGAGWIVDRERRLLITTASAAGALDLVDVVFPLISKGTVNAEIDAYADRIGLRQSQQLVRGLVLVRDPKRDLALVELDSIPPTTVALTWAAKEPSPGGRIHSVSHPSGVELLWLYASGSVRQAAEVELVSSSMNDAVKCRALLLQIPHQAGSSGGAVVDDDGKVVGMLAAKEGAQQQLGYAIASSELRKFLESARPRFAPKTALQFQQRSSYLHARGRISDAISTMKAAVELEPKNVDLRRHFVDLLVRSEKSENLEIHAKFLSRDNIEDVPLIARAFLLSGRRDEALALCQQVLQKDRKNAVCYMMRGVIRGGKEGLADLDEAIFLNPKMFDAYRFRALANEADGDDDKALADWARAIELSPYCPDPIRERARIYLKKHEPKRAVAHFERIVELQPSDALAHRGLATAWLAQGDELKAIPALVAALRWDPKSDKHILKDIVVHGMELARKWPDDPGKRSAWHEQALKAIRGYVDATLAKKISDALTGRKSEWDDKTWGNELEKRIKSLRD